jgi:hypothetical protein
MPIIKIIKKAMLEEHVEVSVNEYIGIRIAQIRKEPKPTNVPQANQQTNVAEPSYAPSDVSTLPIGQFAPTARYKEGGVKGSDGKIYPTEKFNKLGIEKQNLLLKIILFLTLFIFK